MMAKAGSFGLHVLQPPTASRAPRTSARTRARWWRWRRTPGSRPRVTEGFHRPVQAGVPADGPEPHRLLSCSSPSAADQDTKDPDDYHPDNLTTYLDENAGGTVVRV